MIVSVHRIHFLVNVGDEQIHPAVLIEVGGINSHPGALAAFGAECYTGIQSDFLELAFASIGKKEICDGVICDKKIHQTVIVNVGRDYTPCPAQEASDAG